MVDQIRVLGSEQMYPKNYKQKIYTLAWHLQLMTWLAYFYITKMAQCAQKYQQKYKIEFWIFYNTFK